LTRQAHRAQQFSRYFSDARTLSVAWDQLAIFPGPVFAYNQLVALEDSAGFVRGLGILRQADFQKRSVVLHTPLASLADVSALRLGDLAVDPRTYRDQRVTG
jgi:polynucleotide 5'-kinase involved in rRNA processing